MDNRQIILVSRPKGMPEQANFSLRAAPLPSLKENELLIQTLYLSVDPYMRGRMSDRPSYITPFQLNQSPTGGAVGRVKESKNTQFKPGDIVTGHLEWAEYSVSNGEGLQKIDPKTAPISTALGVLGMPGLTAYFGLLDIGQPKAGETVVISGAAGAVGMIAGQIAKLKGCRAIGLAGSDEKVDYLTDALGFAAALNYKKPNYAEELRKSCPNGVDVYFDNVGGDITDQVVKLINWHARIVICGQISMYNLEKEDIGPRLFRNLLVKSALARGFIINLDYQNRFPEGIQQMASWLKEGKLKYHESVVEGIENTPKAFIGLFTGDNIGKQLVKIAD